MNRETPQNGPSSSGHMGARASVENLSRALDRVNGTTSQDSSVREMPLTFALWTTHNPVMWAPGLNPSLSSLSISTALIFDVIDYTHYLESRRFDPAYAARFKIQVGSMRRDEGEGWDFANMHVQDIPSFQEWYFQTRNRATSYEDVQGSGHARYRAAIAAYADVIRQFPEDLDAFMSARDIQAGLQRLELCSQSWYYLTPLQW